MCNHMIKYSESVSSEMQLLCYCSSFLQSLVSESTAPVTPVGRALFWSGLILIIYGPWFLHAGAAAAAPINRRCLDFDQLWTIR